MACAASLVDGIGKHVEPYQAIGGVDQGQRKHPSARLSHFVGVPQIARPRISQHVQLFCVQQEPWVKNLNGCHQKGE